MSMKRMKQAWAGVRGAEKLGPAGCKARATAAANARWKDHRKKQAADRKLTSIDLIEMLRADMPDKAGADWWQRQFHKYREWLETQ